MAYSINKTNGTVLVSVPDGQIDQFTSDLSLIGKKYSDFGEALNENFVKLLENFANTSRPQRPIVGQLWFDTAETKLKVYNGTTFIPVSSSTISKDQPVSLGAGDLWFNSTDQQIYLYDGTNPILLGPSYSTSQGKSGFQVATILDKNNVNRVVTYLYNNNRLLGIFSADQFIPKFVIAGFNTANEEKIIYPGFTAGTLANIKFDVTATNADKLDGVHASNFARKDLSNIFNYQLYVNSDDGISFGSAGQGLIDSNNSNVRINNTFSNRNLEIRVRRGNEQETAINVISSSRQVNIYENEPTSITNIGGNLVVNGNLTVSGTTTSIDTNIIAVADKNIELATAETPTDINANGGGVIIKGTTDHRLVWIYDTAEAGQANESWNTEENINISSGKSYKIDGVDVLTATACLVPSFPNVTHIGTQISLTVDDIFLDDNRIATLTNRNLELAPLGNVEIIGNKKIVGLSTTNESMPSQILESATILSSLENTEATTKRYVTNLVRRRSIVLSIDTSDSPSNSSIAVLLAQLAPPNEYENGTIARLLCTSITNSTSSVNLTSSLTKVNDVEYVTPTGTNFPLQDIAFSSAVIPAQLVNVTRIVKTFELVAGTWAFIS